MRADMYGALLSQSSRGHQRIRLPGWVSSRIRAHELSFRAMTGTGPFIGIPRCGTRPRRDEVGAMLGFGSYAPLQRVFVDPTDARPSSYLRRSEAQTS